MISHGRSYIFVVLPRHSRPRGRHRYAGAGIPRQRTRLGGRVGASAVHHGALEQRKESSAKLLFKKVQHPSHAMTAISAVQTLRVVGRHRR